MTAAFRLGPLGGLREVPLVQRGVSVQSSRSESTFVTLGGRRAVQRSARAARDWSMSLGQWRTPADVAYLTACADGSVPGPLYLHTQDAALTNLLPSDVAAPCRMGTTALGSVAGTVAVGMADGAVPMSGVVQQAAAGAWSAVVPVRQVSHVLSAWASAAGAAVEWRTVTAAGVQVATGTVTAAAVTGGFRGAVTLTPGATVAGVQVRLAAGSRTVGGLRLAEGVQRSDGVEVRRNYITNPRGAVSTGWNLGSNCTAVYSEPGAVFTHTAGTTGNGFFRVPLAALAASTTYTLRFEAEQVAGSVALVARVTDSFATVASATVVKTGSRFLVTAAFTTGTTPPASPYLLLEFAGTGTGEQVRSLGGTVEVGTVAGAPFDGSTSPDPALLPSWTGTPNASPSILKTIPADAVTETWLPGVGVPQVVVSDPQQTMQLVTAGDVRSDYAVTIREVG